VLQMLARGDLRHDPAERLVTLDLRGDEVHAHVSVALEQRHGGFITGRFDTENHQCIQWRRLRYHSVPFAVSP
jgi:hypothetical protein